MIARCCVLALLVAARGGVFIFEQPCSSLMARHPKFVQLMRRVKAICACMICFVYFKFAGLPQVPLAGGLWFGLCKANVFVLQQPQCLERDWLAWGMASVKAGDCHQHVCC